LNYARLNQIQIIPLLARGDEQSAIPFGYSTFQWVDIRNRDAYLNNMKRVLIDLQKRFENVPLSPIDNSNSQASVPALGGNYPTPIQPPTMNGHLPNPFEWVEVAAGETEVDGVKYSVGFFYIAKYPVTVAQYDTFVKAENGYQNAAWWEFSDEATAWHTKNPVPHDPIFKEKTVPRGEVCWYEALAFCRWLQATSRSPHQITLPTEWQWQHAAQGNDKRLYPWGNEYSKNRCNTLKSALNRTTPVTTYPGGQSPYGAYDMCGNVSEWCLSDYVMFSSDVTGEAPRVLRGGAYDSGRSFAQLVIRNYAKPDLQLQTIGFRIAAIPNL